MGEAAIRDRRWFVLGAGLAPLALAACARKPPAPPEVGLEVASDGDLLVFKPRQLTCHSGDHVRLAFHNAAKYVNFQHNWVLIKPHTFDAVIAAANAAGEANGWIPHLDPDIIAATPVCDRGQVVTTEFTAPASGDYLYICTFPGHAQSMWGVLHVLPRSPS
jgi:azurin